MVMHWLFLPIGSLIYFFSIFPIFILAHPLLTNSEDSDSTCLSNRKPLTYPHVRRDNTTFSYGSKIRNANVTVGDPYNWLEGSVQTSSEIQTFIQHQTNLTQSFIDKCSNFESIKQSIQANFDYYAYDKLCSWGPSLDPVYLYNVLSSNDQKPTWYLATQNEIDQAVHSNFAMPIGTKFFNETLLPGQGAQHIETAMISSDKTLFAYTVSDGSEHTTLYFRNLSSPFVEAPKDSKGNILGGAGRLSENIPYSGTYSIAFSPDNLGIFYDRIGSNTDGDAINSQVLYHKFGTDPKDDITLVDVDPKEPTNVWNIQVSQDGKWLILSGFKSIDSLTRMYLAPLDQEISDKMRWLSVSPRYDYQNVYSTNVGNSFYIMTTRDQASDVKAVHFTVDPNKARVVDDLNQLTDELNMITVIPERKSATMQVLTMIDQTILVAGYIEKARSTFYMYNIVTGQLIQQFLQDFIGSIEDLESQTSSSQAFLTVSTFTSTKQTYQITRTTNGVGVKLWVDSKPKSLNANNFKTEQRFATSKDGTKISFYMLYRSDTPFDGSRPAWLYFYGAYGFVTLPKYDPYLLSFVNFFGGTLVFANVRGGGEFSESWHQAGILLKKQNTFDDVIAVANYLADNKIAKRGKIIGDGRSAGGLAAMAVGNQAPKGLFGAIIPEKGPYDMLRYTQFYAGDLQIPEWGDPDVPKDFDYIFPYSPLHNVDEKKAYPMVILSVPANDDRVPPLHAFKMISQLQYTRSQNVMPLLMYYFQGSGHIIGDSSRSTQIQLNAVKQCLTSHCLHLKPRE